VKQKEELGFLPTKKTHRGGQRLFARYEINSPDSVKDNTETVTQVVSKNITHSQDRGRREKKEAILGYRWGLLSKRRKTRPTKEGKREEAVGREHEYACPGGGRGSLFEGSNSSQKPKEKEEGEARARGAKGDGGAKKKAPEEPGRTREDRQTADLGMG